MRFATTLKTLVRSPLKSALTLLLLTATTFAFVSRGVEYVATVQQIRAAEATYFATGTAEMTLASYEEEMYARLGDAAYELERGNYLARTSRAVLPLDQAAVDAILSSEYTEKAEVRFVSGGTHPDCYSVLEQPLSDLEKYNPNKKLISSGTFAMTDVAFLGLVSQSRFGFMHVWSRESLSAYPGNFYISATRTKDTMTESYTYISDRPNNTELTMRNMSQCSFKYELMFKKSEIKKKLKKHIQKAFLKKLIVQSTKKFYRVVRNDFGG